MSERNCWSRSPVTNTQIKNSDFIDNYVALNNWIVANSSYLWHVKGDVKHQCYLLSTKTGMVTLLNKKKSMLVYTFFLYIWVLHFHSVPVATFCSFTTLCPNFTSQVCAIRSGDSYGQDLTLSEHNSPVDLPFLLARGRAQGTGRTAYVSKHRYRWPHPLSEQSSCLSSELVVIHSATLNSCTARVAFLRSPILSCSVGQFRSKQVTFTFLFFCKQSTEI